MRHLQRKILKYNVKKDLKAIKTIKKPLKGISCQGNMDMFFYSTKISVTYGWKITKMSITRAKLSFQRQNFARHCKFMW